jgi:hypothetical protein
MRKRYIAIVFFVGLALLTINALRLAIPRMKGQAKNSGRIPYTVVLAETLIDANGVRRPGTLLTQAVRTDGSTMQRLGQEEKGGRLISLATGQRIMTTPRTEMKSTWFIAAEPDHWSLDPQSLCTKDLTGRLWAQEIKVLGEENIAGHRSVKLKVNEALRWHALDCGCALVKTRLDFGKDGASEMNLVLLTPGEPDPALFSVPPHYKEAKPSVAFCGKECPPDQMTPHFQKMDGDYDAHQRR